MTLLLSNDQLGGNDHALDAGLQYKLISRNHFIFSHNSDVACWSLDVLHLPHGKSTGL